MLDGIASLLSPVVAQADTASQAYLLEARQMQALSLGVHIPLVCFGISFPAIVLFVEGLWLRTGNPVYKQLAKRWSKVMLILFAIGVVTGTILSFELGLLWPNFMERWGEVFGFAFALEGVAFFVEAIFIAIYVYGWDRLPPRLHLLSGLPIVIAGIVGSSMVIAVNGWMNTPQGFELDAQGNVTDVDPVGALLNRNLWHEEVHMYVAGFIVVGALVGAVYSVAWLRGRRDHYHRAGLIVPLAVLALAAPAQVVIGDWAARTVAETQPVKLAAFEGLHETTEGADLTIGGVYVDGKVYGGISIPDLLSLLAFHDPNATVQGLDSVPAEDRPPVGWVRNCFQIMVGIGTLLALLGLWFIYVRWRHGRLPQTKWFYRAVIAAGPLALVALICGWIVTEVGRQPWIVYELMRVEEAVTGAEGIPVGYATLVVVYIGLATIALVMLRRLARKPPEAETAAGAGDIKVLP
ncbi:MAG TPA: cytochrome ubiquinol oxidase subunit I [Solirubrobacterales bacterium]|jgi:cytochrome d ubiquinol oxidase subunit I